MLFRTFSCVYCRYVVPLSPIYNVTGVGFYRIYGTTLLAHKAYVQYSATSGAPKRMRFVFPQEQMPTGIDETNTADKAQKVMENGTLYIIRDGVRYNATGQVAQ